MNNRTQPAGVDNLGCETVSGLRTQKAAYWNAGHGVVGTSAVKEFLGMAMLEERTMNPANYVFGDKYPADDPVISRRNQPKTGYAANGGAIKQNVFALAVSIPNIRNVTNTSVRNASNCGQANVLCWDEVVNTLNTNRSWDVAKFNESKNYFAKIG
nr:hypothetical protein [Spirosomataceae bacterium]